MDEASANKEDPKNPVDPNMIIFISNTPSSSLEKSVNIIVS